MTFGLVYSGRYGAGASVQRTNIQRGAEEPLGVVVVEVLVEVLVVVVSWRW